MTDYQLLSRPEEHRPQPSSDEANLRRLARDLTLAARTDGDQDEDEPEFRTSSHCRAAMYYVD